MQLALLTPSAGVVLTFRGSPHHKIYFIFIIFCILFCGACVWECCNSDWLCSLANWRLQCFYPFPNQANPTQL